MQDPKHLEVYWQAVMDKVCTKCIDGDGTGNCRLPVDQECALKEHFPAVVNAVLASSGGNIDPYVQSLRSGVCSSCENQTAGGNCLLRIQLDCGLDRYLPMVVEAIEETRKFLSRDV